MEIEMVRNSFVGRLLVAGSLIWAGSALAADVRKAANAHGQAMLNS